jgi:hypothetical protein
MLSNGNVQFVRIDDCQNNGPDLMSNDVLSERLASACRFLAFLET